MCTTKPLLKAQSAVPAASIRPGVRWHPCVTPPLPTRLEGLLYHPATDHHHHHHTRHHHYHHHHGIITTGIPTGCSLILSTLLLCPPMPPCPQAGGSWAPRLLTSKPLYLLVALHVRRY